jgi:hypothetical protein
MGIKPRSPINMKIAIDTINGNLIPGQRFSTMIKAREAIQAYSAYTGKGFRVKAADRLRYTVECIAKAEGCMARIHARLKSNLNEVYISVLRVEHCCVAECHIGKTAASRKRFLMRYHPLWTISESATKSNPMESAYDKEASYFDSEDNTTIDESVPCSKISHEIFTQPPDGALSAQSMERLNTKRIQREALEYFGARVSSSTAARVIKALREKEFGVGPKRGRGRPRGGGGWTSYVNPLNLSTSPYDTESNSGSEYSLRPIAATTCGYCKQGAHKKSLCDHPYLPGFSCCSQAASSVTIALSPMILSPNGPLSPRLLVAPLEESYSYS